MPSFLTSGTTACSSWASLAPSSCGVLHEVYSDHDMRVLYGASARDAEDRYLYVMRRVPALL